MISASNAINIIFYKFARNSRNTTQTSAPVQAFRIERLALSPHIGLNMYLSETPAELDIEDDYLLGVHTEKRWAEMQPFLLRRGYRLRPRYDPDWTPSWFQVPTGRKSPHPREFEDSLFSGGDLLDAIRIIDNRKVVLKLVQANTDEIGIAMYLSSEENRRDPRNHCVPILDVLIIPGMDEEALLVMPLLLRFHLLPFRFLGEFSEFALQMLEGLEFMHEHNIAHRDACWNNLMMDATKVIPKGHHFCCWDSHDGVRKDNFRWNTRWSVKPVPYHLIDFGLSTRCESKDTLVVGVSGQDGTVPELSTDTPYNPFMVDVYHIGNVLKACIKEYKGLDVFSDLADAMTRPKAQDRPTMSESVEMCKATIARITKSRKLDCRVWRAQAWSSLSGREKLAVVFGWNPTR